MRFAGAQHEQWDGGGYPHGLKGDAIPLSAGSMALADMYDALNKAGWDYDKAVAEILGKRGSHFDPVVVEAFAAERGRFQVIAQRHCAIQWWKTSLSLTP
ncbi:HD-GYP domain-containing protein [Polynucleobacter necessarius]|uniref:HD-GYP domain-containing protein n=1 Tax=Polynucleobacter necessarius TaxID=576610 RepID=UPI000E09378D|nr:HD domain-containing phosphohydrolase [Polynucleobacter necessarius]HAT39399.1 hypothetical protein [Polynucleobacter sp.]